MTINYYFLYASLQVTGIIWHKLTYAYVDIHKLNTSALVQSANCIKRPSHFLSITGRVNAKHIEIVKLTWKLCNCSLSADYKCVLSILCNDLGQQTCLSWANHERTTISIQYTKCYHTFLPFQSIICVGLPLANGSSVITSNTLLKSQGNVQSSASWINVSMPWSVNIICVIDWCMCAHTHTHRHRTKL